MNLSFGRCNLPASSAESCVCHVCTDGLWLGRVFFLQLYRPLTPPPWLSDVAWLINELTTRAASGLLRWCTGAKRRTGPLKVKPALMAERQRRPSEDAPAAQHVCEHILRAHGVHRTAHTGGGTHGHGASTPTPHLVSMPPSRGPTRLCPPCRPPASRLDRGASLSLGTGSTQRLGTAWLLVLLDLLTQVERLHQLRLI